MTSQIVTDLRTAADILERDGWTQGRTHTTEGQHCAFGAIALAVGAHQKTGKSTIEATSYQTFLNRAEHLHDIVASYLGVWPLSPWNDTPGRTVEQVTAALRETADQVEEEEK